MTISTIIMLIKEILTIFWQGCWRLLSGIWPTLNDLFNVNHKIMIAAIVALLAIVGVPLWIRRIIAKQ